MAKKLIYFEEKPRESRDIGIKFMYYENNIVERNAPPSANAYSI